MTAEVDAVVIGGGMAGLTAAYALVRRGLRPVVLEAADEVGGTVRGGPVAGYEVDLGAESFAVRGGHVRALADELGLAVQEPAGGSSVWAAGPDGRGRAWAIPRVSMLGIPGDLGAPEVVMALGADGVARAARDEGLDASVGADAADLATLVRLRMGEGVLERLVRPVAGGIHSADPADLRLDAVAPGLRAALAEHGSLGAAVRALRAAAPGGAPVATTTGGLFRLPRALATAIAGAGEIRPRLRAAGVRALPDGAWEVSLDPRAGRTPDVLRARRVVVATPGPQALALLRDVVDVTGIALPSGRAVTHVTLVVSAPTLDAAPRGAGLLVAPGAPGVRAKALTHASAKWPWLAAATPPGVHVVRLSYGRAGDPPGPVGPELAVRELGLLMGVGEPAVLGARVVRWEGALAPSVAGSPDVVRLRGAVARHPGLAVTGAWVAGTGVAAVVAGAKDVAGALGG